MSNITKFEIWHVCLNIYELFFYWKHLKHTFYCTFVWLLSCLVHFSSALSGWLVSNTVIANLFKSLMTITKSSDEIRGCAINLVVVQPPQRWWQQHDSVFAQRNPSDTPATGFGSSRVAPFVPLRKLRIPFRLPPIIQDHLRMNVAPDQTIIFRSTYLFRS